MTTSTATYGSGPRRWTASIDTQLNWVLDDLADSGSHVLRDPETARTVMSAFRRGWKEGLADPGAASDAATNVTQEGQQP